ncbi:hypothetical protein C0991_010485, partial [Blastosporella zonata]
IACKNSAGDTARDAQRRARVVRKREKRAAARVVDDEAEEIPGVPDLGKGTDEEEISGEPDLAEERDDGAPVAPEVVEVDGVSESA